MNILHYSLGVPPFRRGGMTQYCMDLMVEQIKNGHAVSLLWPGRLKNLSKKTKIERKHKYEIQDSQKCESYELVNPLPIPLMDGISNPKMYFINKEKRVYDVFFKNHQFDVMHVHTFMGLPEELVRAAHEAGIITVFTTHDYFPICPRCNFFHAGKDCIDDHNCVDCVSCNQYGLSLNEMKIFQSVFYKFVKESAIVKKLRAVHNRKMYDVSEQMVEEQIVDSEKERVYFELRKRYIKLLESLDVVHFNSQNTLRVYMKHGYSGENAEIITISNGAIQNHKKIRAINEKIRLGYLGPITTHKGYNLLKKACAAIWNDGICNFEVHIFVEIDVTEPYIICHKPYKYNELSKVMDQFDILVVPSECQETFGFTVLEALSYGIPVIVSDKVGAKSLIIEGRNGFVAEGNAQALKEILQKILEAPQTIREMNKFIVDEFQIKTMSDHAKEMEGLYLAVRRCL